MSAARWPLDAITVGQRFRRDMGDIGELASSLDHDGLLQPIAIRPDGTLIAGERRLLAARELGWSEIPAHVVDLDAIARGEYAENVHRKDFTLSEMVAIKRALEPLERAAAQERMLSGKPPANLAEGGDARDKVAKVVGRGRTILDRAEAIVDAAEAEPEKYGHLLQQMDDTGRVSGAFRRLQIAKQAESIRAEPPPLPGNGPYRVIVADPAWPYGNEYDAEYRRVTSPYLEMSLGEICALPVGSIAHEDAILWLWTTNAFMQNAFTVLNAWGFEPKTILTWAKDRMGIGLWLRGQTEHCILATRGQPVVTLSKQTTLLNAPLRAHSQKPVEFYDLVESLCPAPRYADLFSRYRHNDKWDCHGDEAPLGAARA
jgi:ParB/RepB/Spo0J family partition protein